MPSPIRSFLFLQGPHGSFFPKLGRALASSGHIVRRINLNGGDFATWPLGDNFRGTDSHWPVYLNRYLTHWNVTDIVLFGDNRPLHAIAIRAAQLRGLRIHVFEEGYIRPDWVTLERDGVNGHSRLPRTPDWYRAAAAGLPPMPTFAPVPAYAQARGWAAFFYYAEVVLQHWRFPFHDSHRDTDPIWEGVSYLRRFNRRSREHVRAAKAWARVGGRPYFLFPLQLNSDYQIRAHSHFGTIHVAILHVLESFAAYAGADTCLIIKEHPLDAGLTPWGGMIADTAARLGIADRIAFLEQGALQALVMGSRGMVTVNSTSGTLSLAAGVPVKVLGDAVYDIPGITHQGSLDGFWLKPDTPDPDLWDNYVRVLANRCLIHGAFLSNAGIDLLVAVAFDRLTAADPLMDPPAVQSATGGGL